MFSVRTLSVNPQSEMTYTASTVEELEKLVEMLKKDYKVDTIVIYSATQCVQRSTTWTHKDLA